MTLIVKNLIIPELWKVRICNDLIRPRINDGCFVSIKSPNLAAISRNHGFRIELSGARVGTVPREGDCIEPILNIRSYRRISVLTRFRSECIGWPAKAAPAAVEEERIKAEEAREFRRKRKDNKKKQSAAGRIQKKKSRKKQSKKVIESEKRMNKIRIRCKYI